MIELPAAAVISIVPAAIPFGVPDRCDPCVQVAPVMPVAKEQPSRQGR